MNGNLSKSIIVVKVIFILLIATVTNITIRIATRTTIQTQRREKMETSSGPQNDFGNFIPMCMNQCSCDRNIIVRLSTVG